jgi:hypothetical protein
MKVIKRDRRKRKEAAGKARGVGAGGQRFINGNSARTITKIKVYLLLLRGLITWKKPPSSSPSLFFLTTPHLRGANSFSANISPRPLFIFPLPPPPFWILQRRIRSHHAWKIPL